MHLLVFGILEQQLKELMNAIFSNKNNSINYDFTGKLPYSWPSRLSINPLNVGAKNYNPLFEYGYGLSYQD